VPRIRRRIEHVFEDVSTWQAEISAALAAPTGLDDPSRIDAIRALEQLVCAATAAQAALAAELDTTETMVIHLAVSRFAKEILPSYEADDGPLSSPYLAWLERVARKQLPKGKVIRRKSLA